MIGNFNRTFNPTFEEQKEYEERYLRLYKEIADKRECSTCANCIQVDSYPGFVIAEECKCRVGLECDTVYFTIRNCPGWVVQESNLLLQVK